MANGKEYGASVKDVAALFKVHVNTVYRWLGSKRPPPHRRPGGTYRFNLAEVTEWAEK